MKFVCSLFSFHIRTTILRVQNLPAFELLQMIHIPRYCNLLRLSFLLSVLGVAWGLPVNFLSAQSYKKFFSEEVLLNDGEWIYSTQDVSLSSLSGSNSSQWSKLDLTHKVYTAQSSLLWMQTKFSLDPSDSPWIQNKALLLLIEGVCGEETVFLNQKKLRPVHEKLNKKKASLRCFRPALYYVFSHDLFLGARENILAIRTAHRSKLHTASIQGKISILPLQNAYIYMRNKSLKGMLYSIFSLAIGFLFFFLYQRTNFRHEYFLFSILSFLYSLYKITQNDFLYSIWDNTLLYLIVHQIAFFMLPALFLLFYIHFYSIQKTLLVSTKNLSWETGKAVRIYALGSLFISLLSVFFLSSGLGLKLQSIWLLIYIPLLMCLLYLSFPKLKNNLQETLFVLLGMVFLGISFLFRLLQEPLATPFLPHEGSVFLAFQISFSVALVMRSKPQQSDRKSQKKNAQEILHIAENFFLHVGQISNQQMHKIIDPLSQIMQEKNITKRQKKAVSLLSLLHNVTREIQNSLLLARLEARPNSKQKGKIQLETLIAPYLERTNLLCHLRIEKETLVHVCSEPFHLFMDSICNFLKKNSFLHTDLIVTTNSENRLIFRFIAFHKDTTLIGKLYRNFIYARSGENSKQNEWEMIQDISRILQGKLTVNNKRSNFLAVSLELESLAPLNVLERKNQKEGLQLLIHGNTFSIRSPENIQNSSGTIVERRETKSNTVRQKREKARPWTDMSVAEICKMIYRKTRSISLGRKRISS